MSEARNRNRDWTQIAIRRYQHKWLRLMSEKVDSPIYVVLRDALKAHSKTIGMELPDPDEEEEETREVS